MLFSGTRVAAFTIGVGGGGGRASDDDDDDGDDGARVAPRGGARHAAAAAAGADAAPLPKLTPRVTPRDRGTAVSRNKKGRR